MYCQLDLDNTLPSHMLGGVVGLFKTHRVTTRPTTFSTTTRRLIVTWSRTAQLTRRRTTTK